MARVTVLVLVASVLLLGTPVRGQTAEEIERLVADLGDGNEYVHTSATEALIQFGPAAIPALAAALSDENVAVRGHALTILGHVGPSAAPAVPALIAALSDEDRDIRGGASWVLATIGAQAVPALIVALADESKHVRYEAIHALREIGPRAAAAIPALTATLSEKDSDVSVSAHWALMRLGNDLKAQGTVLWWVVPYAYWKELVGLLLLLAAWFALMARFPRHRPTATVAHVARMAVTAAVPVALACAAVYYAITREWAQGFLPDTLTLVPFPVAAVLSTALVCALPAVWVCQRKKPTEETEAP